VFPINNIPSYAQRIWAIDIVERNARSKGQYLKKDITDFPNFINNVTKKYPAYTSTIKKCLESTKNILSEIMTWAHENLTIDNLVQLKWFKSFLKTVLNSLRAGLNFALSMLNHYIKVSTSNPGNAAIASVLNVAVVTMATSSAILGIISAVITLGMSLWLNSAEKNCIQLNREPGLLDKIKGKINSWFDKDEDIPEELLPPEPKTPSITMTNIKEDASLVGAFIFLIFLKAAIAHRFNEEIKQKTTILSALFTPTGALLGLLTTMMLVGSGGASAIT